MTLKLFFFQACQQMAANSNSCVNFGTPYIYIKVSERKEAVYNSRSWIKSDQR